MHVSQSYKTTFELGCFECVPRRAALHMIGNSCWKFVWSPSLQGGQGLDRPPNLSFSERTGEGCGAMSHRSKSVSCNSSRASWKGLVTVFKLETQTWRTAVVLARNRTLTCNNCLCFEPRRILINRRFSFPPL